MNRLIIESIEGRVLAGISMFVAIMILIGWVTINEESRMQSFVREHTARSIERGAEQFASKCTTCHGPQGLGIAESAPALNNPHLFGYNPLSPFNDEIVFIKRQLDTYNADIEALNAELTDAENPPTAERQDEIFATLDTLSGKPDAALAEEKAALVEELMAEEAPTVERLDEINKRIAEIDKIILGEAGVLEQQLTEARNGRDALLDSLQPAADKGLYPDWINVPEDELDDFIIENGTRLSQVGWNADLHSYIVTTLIHGRPGSNNVWATGEGMAAWSQLASAPLREDQIEDIAAYILNWDKGDNWTLEDFFAPEQYGKLHVDGTFRSTGVDVETVGTDVTAILAKIEADGIVGDATRGDALYHGNERTAARARLGCSGCHVGGISAPPTEGTWDRVQTVRLADPQFAGYTGEQYIIESIVLPENYIVPTYAGGAMPQVFGQQLAYQDLADIVAYLKSQTAS